MYTTLHANLAGEGEPEALTGVVVTSDVLPLIGVKPVIGRWFTEEGGIGMASRQRWS